MSVNQFLTARKIIGILAKRLHTTTCVNGSVRGLCRANNPFILDFISGDVGDAPFDFKCVGEFD